MLVSTRLPRNSSTEAHWHSRIRSVLTECRRAGLQERANGPGGRKQSAGPYAPKSPGPPPEGTTETPADKIVSFRASKPSIEYQSGALLTSTNTLCHQRSCSETLVKQGILPKEIPSTQPSPRSPLCQVMYGQRASAALCNMEPCAPAPESPVVSVRRRQIWGHVPLCPRQDAQISPPALCLCVSRHKMHI